MAGKTGWGVALTNSSLESLWTTGHHPQMSLRPQLTWYCSQIVVGRGGDCCCRPPLHNPPTDRSATRANRDARTQRTSIFFPCLPPPSGECGAEEYFEF
eukprot:scaffold26039_cov107-Phaeocystis_antarctica.AAC.1